MNGRKTSVFGKELASGVVSEVSKTDDEQSGRHGIMVSAGKLLAAQVFKLKPAAALPDGPGP